MLQAPFSEASCYLWRNKFGGMSVSDAKRLKELEAENARQRKLLAESLVENEIAKEPLKKAEGALSAPPWFSPECPDPAEKVAVYLTS